MFALRRDLLELFPGGEQPALLGPRQKKPTDPPATHNWKSYAGTVEIPAGTKQIVIALQIYGPGQVWFDELEARFVDPTTEEKATDEKKPDGKKAGPEKAGEKESATQKPLASVSTVTLNGRN